MKETRPEFFARLAKALGQSSPTELARICNINYATFWSYFNFEQKEKTKLTSACIVATKIRAKFPAIKWVTDDDGNIEDFKIPQK